MGQVDRGVLGAYEDSKLARDAAVASAAGFQTASGQIPWRENTPAM
jgi:hypothetical protein